MSFLPSQKSLRFQTHHHRHRQTPHHHTHHHRHPRLHTHIHMSQNHVRLPHFIPLPITQTDAITKVNNWMKDGSVCSDFSSSSEAVTAASAPTPATYAEAAAASPTQPPALAIASPIYSPTHSNTYTPPVSSCQAQTILVDNITTKHTRAEIEIKLRRQFPGVRYALTFLKRGGQALVVGNSQRDQHHFETNKMGGGFLWERPLHSPGQQGRAALALCKQSPSNFSHQKYTRLHLHYHQRKPR